MQASFVSRIARSSQCCICFTSSSLLLHVFLYCLFKWLRQLAWGFKIITNRVIRSRRLKICFHLPVLNKGHSELAARRIDCCRVATACAERRDQATRTDGAECTVYICTSETSHSTHMTNTLDPNADITLQILAEPHCTEKCLFFIGLPKE